VHLTVLILAVLHDFRFRTANSRNNLRSHCLYAFLDCKFNALSEALYGIFLGEVGVEIPSSLKSSLSGYFLKSGLFKGSSRCDGESSFKLAWLAVKSLIVMHNLF